MKMIQRMLRCEARSKDREDFASAEIIHIYFENNIKLIIAKNDEIYCRLNRRGHSSKEFLSIQTNIVRELNKTSLRLFCEIDEEFYLQS